MKYNIIGDIHGRTSWKRLVDEDAINVFVGDYFSPYHEEITWDIQKQNFLDIVHFKQTHPQTILLIGNHDEDHWHWLKDEFASCCSRHDFIHEKEIANLFEMHKDLFQAAYAIENKYLVTHAGLSIKWLYKYQYGVNVNLINCNDPLFNNMSSIEEAIDNYGFGGHWNMHNPMEYLVKWRGCWYRYDKTWKKVRFDPQVCAMLINHIWAHNPEAFSFNPNASRFDYYGTSEGHSPMWIRVDGLSFTNIFSGTKYVQVFGHTISTDIKTYFDVDGQYRPLTTGKMVMVDCLEDHEESYIIEESCHQTCEK